MREDRLHERASQPGSARGVTDVQALHLADSVVFQRSQRDTADGRISGEKQTAARRRVFAGKRGELLVEVLEAQVDREPGRVFLEQLARVRDVGVR